MEWAIPEVTSIMGRFIHATNHMLCPVMSIVWIKHYCNTEKYCTVNIITVSSYTEKLILLSKLKTKKMLGVQRVSNVIYQL